MNLWGDRRRLCLSGWLMAALILVGLNAFYLLTLENQRLVGHSPTIKALRENLTQWENAMIAQPWTPDGNRLNPFLVGAPSPPETTDTVVPSKGQAPVTDPPAVVALPALDGVVSILDRRGRQRYLAVLGGRVYRTADRLGPFKIALITPGGVVLSRDDRKWHIPCPKPAYTEDRGN
jgi:hypothetical protein